MELIDPLAQAYAEKFTSAGTDLLKEIADFTNANHSHADMMSSHVQGQFLQLISNLVCPERILEIGTFVGYSALHLVNGLKPGGKLHTIELRPEDASTAKANFSRAHVEEKIILHVGNALEIIPTLKETWDLVFIDADKTGYSAYYKLVLPQVRSGGLIIADNVLFHGQVLEKEIKGKNAV